LLLAEVQEDMETVVVAVQEVYKLVQHLYL
jgi:hypothetical protein